MQFHLQCPICDFSTNSLAELYQHMMVPSKCHERVERSRRFREQQDVRDRDVTPVETSISESPN